MMKLITVLLFGILVQGCVDSTPPSTKEGNAMEVNIFVDPYGSSRGFVDDSSVTELKHIPKPEHVIKVASQNKLEVLINRNQNNVLYVRRMPEGHILKVQGKQINIWDIVKIKVSQTSLYWEQLSSKQAIFFGVDLKKMSFSYIRPILLEAYPNGRGLPEHTKEQIEKMKLSTPVLKKTK